MKNTILASACLSLLLCSCSDSEFEGFKKAENGLHYHFFNQDENGTKVQVGDGILIRYVIMNERNDSVIVDSKNVSRDGSGYTGFGMERSTFNGSFEDGMMMMAKGDSAEFIVPADSFFLKSMRYNQLPPGINSGDHLRGIFKIKDITPKAEVDAERKKRSDEQREAMKASQDAEKPARDQYLEEHKITTPPTASGLYYVETKRGNGGSPKATDTVIVNYKGMLLDGTVFDSSSVGQPLRYPLNQMITGWVEGLQKMKKGGKATLVVPSVLGYGPRANGPIPAFSTLVFELELLDYKPGAPNAGTSTH